MLARRLRTLARVGQLDDTSPDIREQARGTLENATHQLPVISVSCNEIQVSNGSLVEQTWLQLNPTGFHDVMTGVFDACFSR
jgi:hypothetical protein